MAPSIVPPIRVKARGPEHRMSERDEGQHHGPCPLHAGLDHGVEGFEAFLRVGADLADHDQGVAHGKSQGHRI
jgi:hypothetical protein